MRKVSTLLFCFILLNTFLFAKGNSDATTTAHNIQEDFLELLMMIVDPLDNMKAIDYSDNVTIPGGKSLDISIISMEDCFCYVILTNNHNNTAKIYWNAPLAAKEPLPLTIGETEKSKSADYLHFIISRDRQGDLEKLISSYQSQQTSQNFNKLNAQINWLQNNSYPGDTKPGSIISGAGGTKGADTTELLLPPNGYKPFTGQSGYVWILTIEHN